MPLIFTHLPRPAGRSAAGRWRPIAIVGYVTQHDEVVVHRTTCHTIRRLKPLLSVEWQTRPWQDAAQTASTPKTARGLVQDIAAAVTESGIAMSHFYA